MGDLQGRSEDGACKGRTPENGCVIQGREVGGGDREDAKPGRGDSMGAARERPAGKDGSSAESVVREDLARSSITA